MFPISETKVNNISNLNETILKGKETIVQRCKKEKSKKKAFHELDVLGQKKIEKRRRYIKRKESRRKESAQLIVVFGRQETMLFDIRNKNRSTKREKETDCYGADCHTT